VKKRKPVRYVWCAEDEKYGLQAVYETKKAAEKDYGDKTKKWPWPSGFGGTIIRTKVHP
jgi:hypothetical protein